MADDARRSRKSDKGAAAFTLWPMFQGYQFRTKTECFEFTELHQALLDAVSVNKAVEAIEGMLAHARDRHTVSHVAMFLVNTQDIFDVISRIFRKYPVTVQPIATVLHCVSMTKEAVRVLRLPALRKFLRSIPYSDLVAGALVSMIASSPAAAEAFAAVNGDAVMLEIGAGFETQKSDNKNEVSGLRPLLLATAVSLLSKFPTSQPQARIELFDRAARSLRAANPSEMLASVGRAPIVLPHVLRTLSIVALGSADDKEQLPVKPPSNVELAQSVMCRMCATVLPRCDVSVWRDFLAAVLALWYRLTPTATFLRDPDLLAFLDNYQEPVDFANELRIRILYLFAKLVQAGMRHPVISRVALTGLVCDGSSPEQRSVGLQLLLVLMRDEQVQREIDAALTADKIEPTFIRDTRQTENAPLRHRWIAFIHVYSHAVNLSFSSLFEPLATHMDAKRITRDAFKALTNIDYERSADEHLLTQIEQVRVHQETVTIAEHDRREELIEDWAALLAAMSREFDDRIGAMRRDPKYVAWLQLRQAVVQDHAIVQANRERLLDGIRDKILVTHKTFEATVSRQTQEQTDAITKAHDDEMAGIVWDPDELAAKKAALTAKLTRVTKTCEKQLSDERVFCAWRTQLCDSISSTLRAYSQECSVDMERLIVEKEEERARGTGFISSASWYTSATSLMAKEHAEWEQIMAGDTPASPKSDQQRQTFVAQVRKISNLRQNQISLSTRQEPLRRLELLQEQSAEFLALLREEELDYMRTSFRMLDLRMVTASLLQSSADSQQPGLLPTLKKQGSSDGKTTPKNAYYSGMRSWSMLHSYGSAEDVSLGSSQSKAVEISETVLIGNQIKETTARQSLLHQEIIGRRMVLVGLDKHMRDRIQHDWHRGAARIALEATALRSRLAVVASEAQWRAHIVKKSTVGATRTRETAQLGQRWSKQQLALLAEWQRRTDVLARQFQAGLDVLVVDMHLMLKLQAHVLTPEAVDRNATVLQAEMWHGFILNHFREEYPAFKQVCDLLNMERAYRGFIAAEEKIALWQVVYTRPRGKKYRPPKDEEVADRTHLDTATNNRIRQWQRDIGVPQPDSPSPYPDEPYDDWEEAQPTGAVATSSPRVVPAAANIDALFARHDREVEASFDSLTKLTAVQNTFLDAVSKHFLV